MIYGLIQAKRKLLCVIMTFSTFAGNWQCLSKQLLPDNEKIDEFHEICLPLSQK